MPERKKLTKRVVEAIKPGERDIIVWDTKISGFGVVVRPTGQRSYIFKYRVGGGREGRARKPTIGVHGKNITCEQARDIAGDWAERVRRGEDPAGDRRKHGDAKSLSDFCDDYLTHYAELYKKPRSVGEDRRMIETRVKPALGKLKVAEDWAFRFRINHANKG